MARTLTSLRLSPELVSAIDERAGEGYGEGRSSVIVRDLERYYRLLELADTRGGDLLTLEQGLVLVGEVPSRRRRKR